MSGQEEVSMSIVESASAQVLNSNSTTKPMDKSGSVIAKQQKKEDDPLGEMINSAAMSILDGEDFTMGPVPVKTRTGKKKDHVKRPMNAFMVYAQVARKLISKSNSNLQNSEISKKLGELWRRTDEASKRAFIEKAELLRQNHKKEHPDYKYQPRRKKSKANGGTAGGGRCRSPEGPQGQDAELPQNSVKSQRQTKGSRGNKNASNTNSTTSSISTSSLATSLTGHGTVNEKMLNNYCGPVTKGNAKSGNAKQTNNNNNTSSSSSSSSSVSPGYSNYLYGFPPGKAYHHQLHHSHTIHQPLLGSNTNASSAIAIPSSPAHSQTSVHSNVSTPPTTPSSATHNGTYRTDSSSPSNVVNCGQSRPYTFGSSTYEALIKDEGSAVVGGVVVGSVGGGAAAAVHDPSPMALSCGRAVSDWYQKFDEHCSNYQQTNGWPMSGYYNAGGYAHPPVVSGPPAGGQFQSNIMETDVDPKELEQYLDNPAAARKVPSSVYTNHTSREEMYLDLQPGNTSASCGMQIPGNGSHLQSISPVTATAVGGIGSMGVGGGIDGGMTHSALAAGSVASRIHNSNEYYGYKEFY